MSTIAMVLIAIGAVVVILLVASALWRARRQRLEDRRQIASQHRDEADSRRLNAEMQRAAADEQTARARREAAEAEVGHERRSTIETLQPRTPSTPERLILTLSCWVRAEPKTGGWMSGAGEATYNRMP